MKIILREWLIVKWTNNGAMFLLRTLTWHSASCLWCGFTYCCAVGEAEERYVKNLKSNDKFSCSILSTYRSMIRHDIYLKYLIICYYRNLTSHIYACDAWYFI